jgi:two-component system OmpR family sensor kinase
VCPQRDTEPVKYLHMSLSDRLYLYSHPNANMTVNTTDGYQVRVTGRELETPPGSPHVVVVSGLSTDNVRKTLGRLIAIELVIGAAAVVIALFATLYGVRFGLRRLRRVTSTANEVAAELSPTGTGLNRRVDVPNDGTEVGQLAESVNTLLSAVETQFAARLRSEARLRQFLADASHELRTPLTSIRGYAELARMQKAVGADSEDNLSRIESEGTRMSRLVEDLLMLARGDQPAEVEPVRELVDIAELLDDVASTSRAAFPDRRITVEADSGLHIVGDPDQLLRAVRNLVANSAMHTAGGRSILVRGFPDGADIIIQVIDGGPGLPPDQAAHVFERFWRADKARSRVRGGTGLGLAIVASIVAAHGGSVRFDSSVEQGSTVTIRLPGA